MVSKAVKFWIKRNKLLVRHASLFWVLEVELVGEVVLSRHRLGEVPVNVD